MKQDRVRPSSGCRAERRQRPRMAFRSACSRATGLADPPEELGGPPEGLPGEPGWPDWLLEGLPG